MLRSFPLVAALGLSLVASCGEGSDACEDLDLDGFGAGDCANGPDCDDTNPLRHEDCEAVPPPDCSAAPFAAGCPCLAGAHTSCYSGPEGTAGVGPCVAGRKSCVNGHWGICDGEVLPRGERCDGEDQDCDGIVDDGVRSPCGACSPGCPGAVWGEEDDPFVPSEGEGVALGPLGSLTLARDTALEATTVWVANSAEGTVSRIDAIAAVETARYRTGGSEPSRVAVDYLGDAWVANRTFDGISTVVKIAGRRERCVDGDGDGLETSTGPEDVLPFGEDECLLLDVPVGGVGGVARALAIDGDRGLDGASGGNAWVGLHDAQEVVVVDGLSGEIRARIDTPGLSPYASAFDPWGTLWLASRDGLLARIDRAAAAPVVDLLEVPFACFLLYGLAPDAQGRLVLTGFSCDGVLLYEPARGVWSQRRTGPSTRGVSVLDGTAWVAHTAGELSAVTIEPLQVAETFDLAAEGVTPLESIGVGVDGLGMVWTASSQGGPDGRGVATRFDPSSGRVTAQVPIGRAPHTQGDLSGAELVGGFVEAGSLAHVFDGCPGGGETDWLRVHLDVLPGAAGTVEVTARRADDRSSLASASPTVIGVIPREASPFDLPVASGGVLEVELGLATSARDGAPVVRRIGVEWSCPGPG